MNFSNIINDQNIVIEQKQKYFFPLLLFYQTKKPKQINTIFF